MKTDFICETDRLYLRTFTPEDAEHFYNLNLDPEVIQYTGDVAFENIDASRTFLEQYNHYQLHGFGRWAMIRKSDQAYIGWCGLKYTPEKDEVDIGFRLFKQYWNQGYATEAAEACIKFGFETYKLPKIVGRAMKANETSIRVLQKLGLTFAYSFDFAGNEGVVYEITPTMFQY